MRPPRNAGVDVADLSADDLAAVSPLLTADVRSVLTVEGALASRSAYGGTAPDRVREQLAALRVTSLRRGAWAGQASP